jgi:hypothetical protein
MFTQHQVVSVNGVLPYPRRLRKTKIVTTLGPATDRDNNLEKIIAAGANVVRMNFPTALQKITNCGRIKSVKLPQNWDVM